MEFSWTAFWVTIAFWLVQPILSFKERTFSRGQLLDGWKGKFHGIYRHHGRYRWQHLPMSFLNNWSVSIGDPLVWPIFNALVGPHLWPIAGWPYKISVFITIGALASAGFLASVIVHRLWWGRDENLGHIFMGWTASSDTVFLVDLTQAGLAHFWFMAAQVTIVLAYIVMPMPREIACWVTMLLAAFFTIQNVQAVVIQRGDVFKSCMVELTEISALCTVFMVKGYFA